MRTLRLRESRNAYDLDVLGAARELDRRGASSIIAGGAGATATEAKDIPGLKGCSCSPRSGLGTRGVSLASDVS